MLQNNLTKTKPLLSQPMFIVSHTLVENTKLKRLAWRMCELMKISSENIETLILSTWTDDHKKWIKKLNLF